MLDIEQLRADLISYFGTGAFSGMPAMYTEVIDIQYMSEESLIALVQENGFPLSDYIF